jgi:hypothetical protein
MDDLVRDGIYARFIAGCFRDRVRLCKWLSLLVEVGNAINDGAKSKRTIADKLLARLERLPPKMSVSPQSVDRACEQIGELLGVQILLVTRFGNARCTFTAEGRLLWEEAVRWNELGLLESHDLVDFPSVLRLARKRNIGEQNGGRDADIQRDTG